MLRGKRLSVELEDGIRITFGGVGHTLGTPAMNERGVQILEENLKREYGSRLKSTSVFGVEASFVRND